MPILQNILQTIKHQTSSGDDMGRIGPGGDAITTTKEDFVATVYGVVRRRSGFRFGCELTGLNGM
jgi:hypothetical protein